MVRFYLEGTIVSAGLSKWCGAGGWRLGTFSFPPELGWIRSGMCAVASETFTSVSAPIQHAAVTAFEMGPEMDGYLEDSRRILSALGRWCQGRLVAAGLDCGVPQGGFYLFPDLSPHREQLASRGILRSDQLVARLLEETGVALLPGTAFGRPAEELTVRLAYVDFDGSAALEAVAEGINVQWITRFCPRVREGIERIVSWIR